MAIPTPGVSKASRAGRSRSEQIRRVAGIVAVALIALFAGVNTQRVTIHWVVTTTRTPLIVALLVAAVLGAVAISGFSYARRRRRRSRS